mmetsp:Transcript_34966/g.46004  ORF Transcript_34966/g.46004 Transcript_34966/m.46004 type:complete len:106 (-) Transcript_34966:131-448(-)
MHGMYLVIKEVPKETFKDVQLVDQFRGIASHNRDSEVFIIIILLLLIFFFLIVTMMAAHSLADTTCNHLLLYILVDTRMLMIMHTKSFSACARFQSVSVHFSFCQ